jgi:murein DD-endopeptidase MepM/ murein hydrolase activator NlpD
LALALGAVLLLLALLVYHSVFIYGARQGWPVVTPIVQMIASKERLNQERYLKENLDVMARKLGELQAKLVQLDSLGERVAALAGVPAGEMKSSGGAGGPLVLPQQLSLDAVRLSMDALDAHALGQSDKLEWVESRLFAEKMRKYMLPTAEPVPGVVTGSGFGWRIDPLTGHRALHTGLDFPAEVGTPVLAAAGGVVVTHEVHPAYGIMLEIDHGNELITRYAHASRLLVKKGDIVKKGQPVAEVGSTGRSTGAHLHFEVWLAGVAQNPQTFLNAGQGKLTPRQLAQSPAKGVLSAKP